jgi:peptide/nickel transport system substrate-binding protein
MSASKSVNLSGPSPDGDESGAPRRRRRSGLNPPGPKLARLLSALIALLALGLVVTACGNSGSSSSGGGSSAEAEPSEPSEEGSANGGETEEAAAGGEHVLRIGVGAEPLPNPAAGSASGQFSAIIYDLAYAPILHMTPEGEIEPALAESWEYVTGKGIKPNTVFEFTLREGAKFSDGSPVTAEGVAKWLEYFSEGSGPFAGVFGEGATFKAVNGNSVRIELKVPNPSIPLSLSDGGQNAGFVLGEKGMENPKGLVDETDGAGPYMLDSADSVRGDHYTYVPNPNYYEPEAVKFSKVEVKIIAESSSRLQAQASGQIDVAEGEAETASAAESQGLEVVAAPFNVMYLSLNLKENPVPELEDVKVRQAMNLAIDRKSIVEALFENYAVPTSSFVPNDVDASKLEGFWPYDPEKAKKLLAEAGYAEGFELKDLVQGAYLGNLGQPLVQAAAKNLEEVGIKLDINPYSNDPEYAEAALGGTEEYSVATLGAAVSPTTSLWGVYLSPTGAVNFCGEDKKLKELYEEGASSKNPIPAWEKMWNYYTEQAYTIPLVSYDYMNYVSEDVGGVAMGKARPNPVPTEWFPK